MSPARMWQCAQLADVEHMTNQGGHAPGAKHAFAVRGLKRPGLVIRADLYCRQQSTKAFRVRHALVHHRITCSCMCTATVQHGATEPTRPCAICSTLLAPPHQNAKCATDQSSRSSACTAAPAPSRARPRCFKLGAMWMHPMFAILLFAVYAHARHATKAASQECAKAAQYRCALYKTMLSGQPV